MPFRRTGPNWAKAEFPGYKNAKDAARGGTRAEVAKDKIKEKVTRNPKPKKSLIRKGGDQAPVKKGRGKK
jgi:hypothetical protein